MNKKAESASQFKKREKNNTLQNLAKGLSWTLIPKPFKKQRPGCIEEG